MEQLQWAEPCAVDDESPGGTHGASREIGFVKTFSGLSQPCKREWELAMRRQGVLEKGGSGGVGLPMERRHTFVIQAASLSRRRRERGPTDDPYRDQGREEQQHGQ